MFTLQTRISDALAQRPELRTLLPAFHPAFAKLNHPVLGKVLPRLVTVEDAAKVAGVDAQALLAVMNLPGHAAPKAQPVAPVDEPSPAWLHGAPITELDVRAQIAAGEEPFPLLMAGFRELKPGGVLQVLAPFEPAPLRRLMQDRGWSSHLRWDDGTAVCSFFRPPTPSAQAREAGERLSGQEGAWVLDLRGLEPPGPMQLVLGALEAGRLPLTLLHHREPALLYPKLSERGLRWTVAEAGDHLEIKVDRA